MKCFIYCEINDIINNNDNHIIVHTSAWSVSVYYMHAAVLSSATLNVQPL